MLKSGNVLEIKGIRIGEGVPKIIVPIVEKTEEEILKKAEELKKLDLDAVEWRADHYENVKDPESVSGVLKGLEKLLKEKILLFTVRTKAEGGEIKLTDAEYAGIIKNAAEISHPDMIDIEMLKDEELVRSLVVDCHWNRIAVVGSNHDFNKTPERDELIRRLKLMQSLNADVLKIAVMPKKPADVLTLLSVTEEMSRRIPDRPLITMSMSGAGAVSRIAGGVFGSAMTFGSVGQGSAPGQIPLKKLRETMTVLHEAL